LSFLLHRTFTSGYLCTIALILFIHVGFLEYLSFKQFKLIVKMTRIESGVTIPKGLFTLYLNVKNFLAAIVRDGTSLGFLVEAEPRLENRRGLKPLFGQGAHNVFRVGLGKILKKT
jgi:hypothetical protein